MLAQFANDDYNPDHNAEVTLWRFVVKQAMQDVGLSITQNEGLKYRRPRIKDLNYYQSLAFLTQKSGDYNASFRRICEMASIDLTLLQRNIINKLKQENIL